MTNYSEIDRSIVINKTKRGFQLRIWNETGTVCVARGYFDTERKALNAGRRRLSYLLAA